MLVNNFGLYVSSGDVRQVADKLAKEAGVEQDAA